MTSQEKSLFIEELANGLIHNACSKTANFKSKDSYIYLESIIRKNFKSMDLRLTEKNFHELLEKIQYLNCKAEREQNSYNLKISIKG